MQSDNRHLRSIKDVILWTEQGITQIDEVFFETPPPNSTKIETSYKDGVTTVTFTALSPRVVGVRFKGE